MVFTVPVNLLYGGIFHPTLIFPFSKRADATATLRQGGPGLTNTPQLLEKKLFRLST